jgi:hypothetical protein
VCDDYSPVPAPGSAQVQRRLFDLQVLRTDVERNTGGCLRMQNFICLDDTTLSLLKKLIGRVYANLSPDNCGSTLI